MAATKKSVLGVVGEIVRLKGQTAVSLRRRYDELYPDQPARSNNSGWLLKKIAARLQEQPGLVQGEAAPVAPSTRDPRLPQPGAVITKTFKGREVKVLVTSDGFEFEGTRYRSLSAIARKIAGGTSWNGFGFFNLLKREGK